ncbi:nucleoside triphosphate hydrolase [Frigidibacter sp. ROC022]|uniref:nucleoside triphosphate hydrolase n=1 Tax=Frigidibacter sp. ROC022 TaxID=2971796 RepID=UPI00215A987D|nr:nucleoside triphosphate hydrolase [Frigidibacter sp. ROC022]MCR8726042.1 nucleoside triphosphate hydrolase [Frigidibacter sp. ROC022]
MSQRMDIDGLTGLLAEQPGDERCFVAIAGAPGAGKSTVAAALVERLNAERSGAAALLPMDGFHYDDELLRARGSLARKGAPDTFDVAGLRHMLIRLRDDGERDVAVPVFDRSLEIARAGARLIGPEARIIVVEGNYLLLDEPPWDTLRPLFDKTVMLEVPEPVLRARLEDRWRGFALSPEEITRKLEENDLPNGRRVIRNSVAAEFVLDT